MANDERIDQIVDERAFQQLDKLIADLDRAQKQFAESAQAATAFSNAIGKAKTVTELTAATKQADKAMTGLAEAETKVTTTATKAAKAEQELVSATKQHLLSSSALSKLIATESGTLDKNIKTQARLKLELKRVRDEQKKLAKETRGQTIGIRRFDESSQKLLKTEERLKVALQQNGTAIKQQVREVQAASGSYNQMTNRLLQLKNAYKELTSAERQNVNIGGQLERQIKEQDAALKNLDARMGVHNRNVGNYRSALSGAVPVMRNFLAAFGVIGGVQIFANVIRDAGKTVAEFQTSQTTLAGVLDSTRDAIGELTDQAKQLGATTAASAVDVSKLQTELARLGFSQQQIIDLTPAIITGSIALQAEFSQVALTVGAVVKTFDDLDSVNAPEIIDQMTAAANLSAISFKTLETAIPILAGAANAAGISFTRMLALLGKLSDAGIDASMSATALRNIFIESAAQGLSYEQILETIAASTDKLTASNDQFGKRAAVSGTILAGQLDTLDEFEQKLSDAGGTAQRLADEQLSTLNGALLLLKSAWAGLILEIESGDGVISKVVTGIIRGITTVLSAFTQLGNFLAVFPSVVMDSFRAVRAAVGELDINLLNPAETIASMDRAMVRLKKAVIGNVRNLRNAMNIEAERVPFDIFTPEDIIDPNARRAAISGIEGEGGGGAGGAGSARKRITETNISLQQRELDETIKLLEQELAARIKLGGDGVELEKELARKKKELDDDITANALRNIKRRQEQEQAAFELSQELVSLGFDLFQSNVTRDENKLREDLDALEQRKQATIAAAQASAASEEQKAARIQIAEAQAQSERERIEKKQRALDVKRAKFEKAQSIASIISNTARAVVQALPNIPLSILVGAIGAVQLARAVAQPIPQFFKGTENAPGGLAWVGEKGTEAVVTPSGKAYLTPGTPTLANLEKGSKVITNHKLQNYLANNTNPQAMPTMPGIDISRLADAHRSGTNQVVKAINNRPERVTTLTPKGLRTAYKRGGSWRRYINRNI